MPHREFHRADRTGWLRAVVLGANDGIISTSSLVVGVASAQAPHENILIAAVAGLVAGAFSMAAGEYVSVSSQADTEGADLARERRELETEPVKEHDELASIYVARGLTPELAEQVAVQLMNHDALGAHARDELGLSEGTRARPLQAALASAASFAGGGILPVVLVAAVPVTIVSQVVTGSSLILLAVLGGVAARLGGARILTGTARVVFWGALAMGSTALIGRLIGASL